MSANDENISDYAAFRADNKLIFHCPQMSAKYTVRNVCSHYNHICHILVEINSLFFSLLLAAKNDVLVLIFHHKFLLAAAGWLL